MTLRRVFDSPGLSGPWSYIAAGEPLEAAWRVLSRMGLARSPSPFIRAAGRPRERVAGHLIALVHTLEREGAPICLLDVLRGLAARGVKVTLVAPAEGPLAAEARAAGIALVFAPPPQFGARGARSYEAALDTFAGFIAALKPNVVLANTLMSFHGLDAARAINVPSVLVVHEGEPPARFFSPWPRAVQARALGAITYPKRIVFVSRNSAEAWPITDAEKTVIRNAPDPAAFHSLAARWTRQAARESLNLSREAFVFLSVGAICRRKGQEDLVRAATALAPAQIFCVGPVGADGALIAKTLRACANVTLAGATHDVARYYAAADAFVLTSRIENYPRVVQEAQAFGLPLVLTPINGVPEQAGENEALFYRPGDIGALVAACRRLTGDSTLRARLGAASSARALAFESYGTMVDAYAEILSSV